MNPKWKLETLLLHFEIHAIWLVLAVPSPSCDTCSVRTLDLSTNLNFFEQLFYVLNNVKTPSCHTRKNT